MKIGPIICGIALIGLAIFGLASCSNDAKRYENPGDAFGIYYTIINIEGCEYIKYNGRITHKGNCTNNIHIYRAENNETHR